MHEHLYKQPPPPPLCLMSVTQHGPTSVTYTSPHVIGCSLFLALSVPVSLNSSNWTRILWAHYHLSYHHLSYHHLSYQSFVLPIICPTVIVCPTVLKINHLSYC